MIHFANISNQENVWLLSIKTDYMLTKLLGNSWLFFGAVILFFLSACTSLRPADSSIPKPRKPRSNTSRNISSLRTDIIRTARKYKGSKYKYGGTTPKGFDCSGFTSYVLLKNKVDLDRTSGAQAKQGKKIRSVAAQPGDLLFFGSRGKVSHVAIITQNDANGLKVIHSTSSKGVIEQNITHSDYWQSRLLFARKIMD